MYASDPSRTLRRLTPICQGTSDRVVPIAHALKVKECIHMADLVFMEGGSHFLPWEDELRESVADAIVAFLV